MPTTAGQRTYTSFWAGSKRWHEQLAFRDALRADPLLVKRYARIKEALAAEHADDREAYTAAKAGFVRRALVESR